MNSEAKQNSKIELTFCTYSVDRTQTFDYVEIPHKISCKCKHQKSHPSCLNQCISRKKGCIRSHYWQHVTSTLDIPTRAYLELYSHSKDANQIELDLTRTFPDNSYFSSDSGVEALNRVLNKFSNYMPDPGYVQGMNFIAAAFLWHSSEAQAFWFLVKLMTDYKLSENFTVGLPGLLQHFEVIENYVKSLWPDFFEHMQNNSILTGMYVTDWIVTLYTNIIPLNKTGRFFSHFFDEGWSYFYRFTLEIIDRLKKKCMKLNDRLEILAILKPFQMYSDPQQRFLNSLIHSFERKNWNTILKSAKKRKLPSSG